MSEHELEMGRPAVNRASGSCCGKPQGCNMTHEGCLYLRHPWKIEHVYPYQKKPPRAEK